MRLRKEDVSGHPAVFQSSVCRCIQDPPCTHVRPPLEYGGPVVSPYTLTGMGGIEVVQRYATQLVEGLCGTDYEVQLRVFHLLPTRYRQLCGDLICLWKILHSEMDPELLAEPPLCSCDGVRDYRLILLELNSTNLTLVYRLFW